MATWPSLSVTGAGMTCAARAIICSANPPASPPVASTRSPRVTESTPSPSSTTVPATSLPGTNGSGGLSWYSPWASRASTKLTPAAATSIRTAPGPHAAGASCSSTVSWSSGPNEWQTTARTAPTVAIGAGSSEEPQKNTSPMVWMARPARPPTSVPLIRMNWRSRPTCSSILRLVASASQRSTVEAIRSDTSLR